MSRHLILPVALAFLVALCACENQQSSGVGTGPSVVVLVGPDETGEPLILSGRVFKEDGTTPLPGARIDVYHTDAGGYYTRPISRPRDARIRGSVWTDSEGRYEIRTIMPGKYPNQPAAAHIHVHLAATGVPDHWIDSYHFADDPYLDKSDIEKNRDLGDFSAIVKLTKSPSGEHTGIRNIRLDPELARKNYLVDGWYQGE